MDHVDLYQANPGDKNAPGVNIERNHGVSSADWFLPSLFRVQFACDLFFCSAAFSVATHCAQQWHRSSTLPSTTMARILPAGHRRCINEDYAWRLAFSWCVCVSLVNGFVWWLARWWCLWLLAQVCGSDWTLGLCVFCIGQGHEGEQRIQRLHQSMILVVVMWLLVQLITSYHEDII